MFTKEDGMEKLLVIKFGYEGFYIYSETRRWLAAGNYFIRPLELHMEYLESEFAGIPREKILATYRWLAEQKKMDGTAKLILQESADGGMISVLMPKLEVLNPDYVRKNAGYRKEKEQAQAESTKNGAGKTPKAKKEKKATDPRIKRLIDYFFEAHKAAFDGEKPLIDGGKDGDILGNMLATFTEEEIKAKIDAWMAYTDKWIKENKIPHTIAQLKFNWPKLQVKSGKALTAQEREVLRQIEREDKLNA